MLSRTCLPRAAATVLLLAAVSSSSAAAPAFAAGGTPVGAPVAASLAAPAAAPAVAAPAAIPVAAATAMRITVPQPRVLRGQPAAVWVRLVTATGGVPSAPISLQRVGAHGWATVAHLTTGEEGLAHVALVFPSTSQLRAVFTGELLRRPSASPVAQLQVVAPAPPVVPLGQRAVAEAARHAGAPYVYGAAGPDSFDCSGLVMYVFARLGRSLPHNAAAQAGVTMPVSGAPQLGDLLFFGSGGGIGHVGIYAGNGMVWNAPHSGDVVRLQPVGYFGSYSVGRVR